ncbi:unnamed protein product [Adineta steineri]|uniref:Carboxylic ester hydrolase n=1 Tax=Adineta steineri TaxID=433720 RepID=A0A814DJQ8_9BILA|nr:unnamed protein product [Adineta steineri]CAF0966025.1 unnamed protein product [Adineta steineri]
MFLFWIFYILLIKTVFGLNGGPYIFANESVGSPVVSTTSGTFAGFTIRQTNVWIGIPYANPPIGTLRWAKAQPYTMNNNYNNTIRNATYYSSSCPQVDRGDGSTPGPFDEDCLYLNVWAPSIASSNSSGYPVMLWIHGGAFIEGSSSQAIYDGLSWTNAAIQENNSFIMVSFNYRLSVMGFFSQTTLLNDNGKPIANQGITDQRMAMKWVQDNIAQFGGNKNSITLMGESAGSQSVCIHMVSPLSNGLYHAGILESGSCDTVSYMRDKSFAYSVTNNLASLVGCNMTDTVQQLTCLRTINSTLLIATIANVSIPPSTSLAFKDQEKIGGTFPFSVIVDEVEIPVHPLQAFLSGTANQVPVLTGANHDEFLLRVMYDVYFKGPTSAEDYLTRILPIVTFNHSEIQTLYTPDRFNGNYSLAFVTLMSQQAFLCSTRRIAGYMNKQPTYLYTFTHIPEPSWLISPNLVIWPGAYHIAEVFYLFQTLAASFYGNMMFECDEIPFATSMRRYWTNMITKHQPNDNVNLMWPQYSSSNDQILVLNKNMTTSTFIEIYPNCDLLSDIQAKVYGEFLGLNVTCAVGNKCFIINSTSNTNTASTFATNYLYNLLLNTFLLFFSYIIFLS